MVHLPFSICIGAGNWALFDSMTVLSKISGLWERVIGESLEIAVKSKPLNCDVGLVLSTVGKSVPNCSLRGIELNCTV